MSSVTRIQEYAATIGADPLLIIREGERLATRRCAQIALRKAQGLPEMPTTGNSLHEKIEALFQKRPLEASEAPINDTFDVDINEIKTLVKGAEKEKEIIAYCERQVAAARQNLKVKKAHADELLGMIIYLLNEEIANTKDIANTATLITQRYFTSSAEKYLRHAFHESLSKSVNAFHDRVIDEDELDVIDSVQFSKCELPKVLAEFLISDSGFFNIGIIPAVQKSFGELSLLDDYRTDGSLVNALLAAKAPQEQDSPSSEIIRLILGIAPGDAVTYVDAMRAHLATQLTYGWVGQHEEYYTSAVAKLIMKKRPLESAKDFNDLIMKGKLGDAPLTLIPDSAALQKKIKITKEGLLGDSESAVWESEAIQAAIKAMGIQEEQVEETVKHALAPLPEEVTIHELIGALGKEEAKTRQGLLAFSSLTSNPLLFAWEECLAKFGNEKSDPLVRGKIVQSVQASLQGKFRPKNVQEKKLLTQIFKDALQNISDRIVLQQKGYSAEISMKGVENAAQFSIFVYEGVFDAVAKATQKSLFNVDREAINRLSDDVLPYIHTEEFIKAVDAPWKAVVGNDAYELLDANLSPTEPVSTPIAGENPATQLGKLITFAKEKGVKEGEQFQISSDKRVLSFLHAHPTFVAAVSAEEFVKGYAGEYKISLTLEQRDQVIEWAQTRLVHQNDKESFKRKASKLSADLPLKEFRTKLLELAREAEENKRLEITEKEMGPMLDRHLIKMLFHKEKMLTEDAKALLKPVHFAASSLKHDSKAVHYCFYRDPLSESITIGMILEDGSRLIPVAEEDLATTKEWNVTEIKADLAV